MKFLDFNLNKPLWNALHEMGFEDASLVQERVFKTAMAGKDIIGVSPTGSGKTLAYLLPLLRLWSFSKERHPKVLILTPTRELTIQVKFVAEQLSRYMNFKTIGLYGGINIKQQIPEVSGGSDLIVATPGRFLDMVKGGLIKGKYIKKLVIDEFDQMLDLGFWPQLEQIFLNLPKKRQNLLFSATFQEQVKELLKEEFFEPELIEVLEDLVETGSISERVFELPNFKTKVNFLDLLLHTHSDIRKCLVFVATREKAQYLYEELKKRGIEKLDLMHSNKSQNYRFEALRKFEENEINILIATDLVSRGIDVATISHVINMDLPESAEGYTHRIGRTGRAGQSGVAFTFFSPKEGIEDLEESLGRKLLREVIPNYLEIESEELPFEYEFEKVKFLTRLPKVTENSAFHDKVERNQKVNVRRNIEKEKMKKYGKAYRKKHE